VLFLRHLDAEGTTFSSLEQLRHALVSHVKESAELHAYLSDASLCSFFSEAKPPANITEEAVDQLYVSVGAGAKTFSIVANLEASQRKFKSLEELTDAIHEQYKVDGASDSDADERDAA